jgi:hypothetical protein
MSARAGVPIRLVHRAPRARAGVSLIEVVVACTLLALTFTSLTALSVRMAARNRSNAYTEQRTATFFEQVNRVESLPYDSLSTYLVTDSAKYGQGYYVWAYTVDPESTSTSGRARYRKISLTVTPRLDPTHIQKATIRRGKSPFANPLNN